MVRAVVEEIEMGGLITIIIVWMRNNQIHIIIIIVWIRNIQIYFKDLEKRKGLIEVRNNMQANNARYKLEYPNTIKFFLWEI